MHGATKHMRSTKHDHAGTRTDEPRGSPSCHPERYADRMRDIDVEKMERLFALSREFAKDVADTARREFYEAFNTATESSWSRSASGAANSPHTVDASTRSRRTSRRMLDPLLIADWGSARSMSTEPTATHADHIRMRADAPARRWATPRQHRLDAPIDGVGVEGRRKVMTRLHGAPASYHGRYVERYLLTVTSAGCRSWPTTTGTLGAGVGPGAERITEDQALDLEAKMEEHGVGPQGRAKLLTWLGVEKLSDLPASKLKAAMDAVERRAVMSKHDAGAVDSRRRPQHDADIGSRRQLVPSAFWGRSEGYS